MKSSDKALRYFAEERVHPLMDSSNTTWWCVEGDSGVWVVRYDKLKEIFSCSCKNVRLTPCSHIKAVLINKTKENDDKKV